MFDVAGTVVHGEKRGRELGFPTANVDPERELHLPVDGVYAGLACLDGEEINGETCWVTAISVGTNPTFGINARTVEAFLLDFDGDLYGRRLALHGQDLVRPMQAFESVGSLVEQMGRDVAAVRESLATSCHAELHGTAVSASG